MINLIKMTLSYNHIIFNNYIPCSFTQELCYKDSSNFHIKRNENWANIIHIISKTENIYSNVVRFIKFIKFLLIFVLHLKPIEHEGRLHW
jgi:hypothetical protein